MSQPALSVAIQKLEEELGARCSSAARPRSPVTPVGERIVEQAQKVLEEAARDPGDRAGGPQPARRARSDSASIYTVAPYLLPDLIPALHERAPQMPLEIEENLTEHLEAELKSGRIDAAIVALPFAPPGVVTEFLYEEPFQVVVPRGHKWARAQVDARRRTCRRAHDPAQRRPLLSRAGAGGVPGAQSRRCARHARTNSLETVRNMVASGLGVSVLPRDALTPKYHSQLVVPVPFARPVPSRRIALACRKSFPRPAAIARHPRRGRRLSHAKTGRAIRLAR